jgi:hypothetical protein
VFLAIFVFIGWVIQLGEKLGLLETESRESSHQAYRLAIRAQELLKVELSPVRVRDCQADRLEYGEGKALWADGQGRLWRSQGESSELLLELGTFGKVRFARRGGMLEVRIRASVERRRHWARMLVPVED